MLSLSDCLRANRPLIFCSCENEVEILNFLNQNLKNNFQVYSSTYGKFIKLSTLIEKKFQDPGGKKLLFTENLDYIYNRTFPARTNFFETYIFLDVDLDKQGIRKIKDILAKYQTDYKFTVNMIFISQTVKIPPELERYSEVVYHDLPTENALKERSDELCGPTTLNLKGDKIPSEEVIINLKGLTLFEMEQAYLQSYKLYGKIDLKFIRDFKKASIAKTDLLELFESDATFDDVGGLSILKEWILKSRGGWTPEGKKFGLPQLKGVLLVGPPGCGKSLSAKAVGNCFGLPVINFDPSRVLSGRVGDSELNMRRVLKIIEGVAPCVLFIDEIEKALAGSQSSTFSDSGVTARVIKSFLIWMQDSKAPVFTVATSNNIQYMPPELISRFDQTFFVNVPQRQERLDIFKIQLAKIKRDPAKFDCDALADNSTDFVGREIEQALKEAMYDSFNAKSELTTQRIINVLRKKTNILTTMAEQLNYLLKWVGWDPSKKDGVRARYAHPVEEGDRTRVMDQIDKLIQDVEKGKPFEGGQNYGV